MSHDVEWDEWKAHSNFRKHGIDFADAVSVLEDDLATTITEDIFGELRFMTVGMDARRRVLVVVWTLREERVRIISARKASRQERRAYEGRT